MNEALEEMIWTLVALSQRTDLPEWLRSRMRDEIIACCKTLQRNG